MKRFNRYMNSRGETLIELLIATVILGMTLTVIISIFMSGRSNVVSSWDRTEENLAALDVMEQLKATSYETLKTMEANDWMDLSATSIPIHESLAPYEIQVDVVPYQDYSVEDLLQVHVRVRDGSERPWIEKASLIRKGDSS